MAIDLTPQQKDVIEHAIRSGLVRSVDEFINSAMGTLSRREGDFDKEKARLAGQRIRQLRKGITLELGGSSIRDLAHAGHKY